MQQEKAREQEKKDAIESGEGHLVPTPPFPETTDGGDILTVVGSEALDADVPEDLTKKSARPLDSSPPSSQNPAPVKSQVRVNVKDQDRDDELLALSKALLDLHKRFFALVERNLQASMKVVISTKKREVLGRVVILFSGVIPLEKNPRRSDLWRLAESFGALCTDTLDIPNVTHVVAMRKTEKVTKALKSTTICIVTLDW